MTRARHDELRGAYLAGEDLTAQESAELKLLLGSDPGAAEELLELRELALALSHHNPALGEDAFDRTSMEDVTELDLEDPDPLGNRFSTHTPGWNVPAFVDTRFRPRCG